jgi:hypothetical protein
MLFSKSLVGVLAILAVPSAAHPSLFSSSSQEGVRSGAEIPRLLREREELQKRTSTFNAAAQYVDVTGAHAYVSCF